MDEKKQIDAGDLYYDEVYRDIFIIVDTGDEDKVECYYPNRYLTEYKSELILNRYSYYRKLA